LKTVDAEDQGDAEGAEDLDVNPELGDPAHHPGASGVQPGLDREQRDSHKQDRHVVGRV